MESGGEAVNDAVPTIVAELRHEGIRFAPPAELALVGDPAATGSSDD